MRKYSWFVCMMFACVLLTSCIKNTFHLSNDVSTIETIEIVQITGYDLENKLYIWDTLYQSDDNNSFAQELLALPTTHPFRPPLQIDYGWIAIYIGYKDDTSQLISCYEQVKMDTQGIVGYQHFHFNYEQYKAFIHKYVDVTFPEMA